MRRERTAMLVLGLAIFCVVSLGSALSAALEDTDTSSLLVIWLSALLACVFAASETTRIKGALCALLIVLALATVAWVQTSAPVGALMFVILVAGVATLFEDSMHSPEIIITEPDSDRLSHLLDILPNAQRTVVAALERELERAHVVIPSAVPPDVVTMNSRVVFEDAETGRLSEAKLVYPHDAAKLNGSSISVLAPVGSALLGLRAGQSIDWPMPTGRRKRYRVVDVVYQPEAAGDYHL